LQSKNTTYLERLDHLRALAVFCVILFEFQLFIDGGALRSPSFRIPLIDQGHVGVTLFMVISGFILSHIASGGDIDISKFYLNRVLRIYPLLVVIVALGYFATPDPRPTQTGLDFLLALLPISNMYRLNYGAYGGMLWSIGVELQFYLLFPFIWLALRSSGWRAGVALICFMIGIRAAVYMHTGTVHQLAYFSLFGCLDAFTIGCLTQIVYERVEKRKLPSWLPIIVLLFIGVIVSIAFSRPRFFNVDQNHITADGRSQSPIWVFWPTIIALCFGVLLLSYLLAQRGMPGGKMWAFVGRISFSMYVWQYLVFLAIRRWLTIEPWLTPYELGLLVTVLCVLPVSAASYYVIERPFLQLRVHYLRRSMPQSETGAALKSETDMPRLN
jgi:peptidoglycan/LPS O-acetylase OafA/YrhL